MVFKREPNTFDSVVKLFIDWVLKIHASKMFSEINVVAHYGNRFDNFIVFSYLIQSSDKVNVSPPVCKGCLIVVLKIEGNITFKDSCLFLMMPLKKLPSVFGFDNFVRKGFFPYKFLTQDRLDYNGRCPPISEFDTTKMTSDEIQELTNYIDGFNSNNRNYSLMDECVSYCISDVTILRLSFQSY